MANRTGIYGDREVVSALRQLASIPVSDVDKSAVESMEPMREEVVDHYRRIKNFKGKTTFPQGRKGTLPGTHIYQSLRVRKKQGNAKNRQYWLAASGRALNLAHLVEFGTAPHFQPKMGIMHPGARPSPGMAPAFEAHGDDVVERMGKALWERIRDRAITLGKKSPQRRR